MKYLCITFLCLHHHDIVSRKRVLFFTPSSILVVGPISCGQTTFFNACY